MSSRSERDKEKALTEKHQMILSQLLKDEDNKYCVDCDAKGPRWASWNLGIFLCIRCAGIHRNLGVHISKVKSVNLDTWTAYQIAMVQEMGNSRARAVYEANLPDNFRRPQTDSGLEAFIRAKYEQKKYIAQEWNPPTPRVQPVLEEPPKKEKKKSRPRPAASVQLNNVPPPSKTSAPARAESKPSQNPVTKESKPAPPPAASVDLLGLDTPAIPASNAPGSGSNDPFGEFIGGGSSIATSANGEVGQNASTDGSTTNGLQDMNLFGETAAPTDKQKATKESILALYGSGGNTQMFGVPGGMYMPQQAQQPQQQQQQQQQQPQQQQMWAAGGMQNGGMPPNMGMMGNNMLAGVQQPEQPNPQPNPQPNTQPNPQPNLMVVDPLAELQASVYQQQGWVGQPCAAGQPGIGQPCAGQPCTENNPFLQQQVQQYAGTPGNPSWNGQAYAAPMFITMQPNMMMGQMPANNQAAMMQQANMMYNMPAAGMYNMPQQMQQAQHQMGAMNLGGAAMGGMQQPGLVAAGGTAGSNWGSQASGQTLSNNLWQ